MGRVVTLVQPPASSDTILMLRSWLRGATDEEIIGAGGFVIFRGRHYVVDVAGAARDDPTWSRGIIKLLDDRLAELPDPRFRR